MNKRTCKIPSSLTGPQPEIDKLIASGNPDAINNDLIIDFSECTFISVSGLEWLQNMLLRAGTAGINVSFTAIPPVLYKVFKVARIENILNACGSPSGPSSGMIC